MGRKKCAGSRVKGVRSASPRRLQKSKVSSGRVKSIRNQLKKLSNTRSQYKKSMRSPRAHARYGKQVQFRMNQLNQKEIKLKRQLPKSKSKSKAKSAPGKFPSRPHRQSDLHLMRQRNRTRRSGETQAQFQRRQLRRRLARTHRHRPPSPVDDMFR